MKNIKKVYWFNDSIFHATFENKKNVENLTKDLISKFARRDNENTILDPIELSEILFHKINIEEFDTILSLSNKYTPLIEKAFPNKNLTTHFIARIRDVTKGNWPIVGYWKELKTKKLKGRVLIFDDVGFSGGTLLEAIKDFGLKDGQFEIALLVSVKNIRERGWKVHQAIELNDKIFELWHLEDWINKIPDNLLRFLKTDQTIEAFLEKNNLKEKQVNPSMWMNKDWVESFWQSEKIDEITKELNKISKVIKSFDKLNPKYAPKSFYKNSIGRNKNLRKLNCQ